MDYLWGEFSDGIGPEMSARNALRLPGWQARAK
jgi:hypothetical protein